MTTSSHTVALLSDGTLLAWGSNGAGQTVVPSEVWTNLGGDTPGSSGVPPTLAGIGTLDGGTPAAVWLRNAPPSALMLAWISFAPTPLPALGGMLHAWPYGTQLALVADTAGSFTGATTWPLGIPPGTEVWFQFLVEDASTLHGITLSNGLLATTL